MMETLINQMEQVWITCPRCSVNYKESIVTGDPYNEISLCAICNSLCEKCEDNPKIINNNLCTHCYSYKCSISKSSQNIDNNIKISKVGDDVNEDSIDESYIEYISNKENNVDAIKKYNYKVCKLVDKHCNKHPVDSVDAPINGTLNNKSIEIILEGLGDLVSKNSIILDLGSGNGKTAAKFSSILNAVTVGIEYDKLRYECSMVNLQSILKHFDISVTFINGNIESYFKSFNGYDIVYMFDTAFIPSTIQKIKEALNKSSSVKAIICNSKLDDLGFDVSLFKSLGALTAGNTNRNFYIYTSNIYDSNYIMDDINKLDIQRASNKEIRVEEINTVSEEFLNKSRNVMLLEKKDANELYLLLQKSPVTINGEEFIKADQVVGATDKQSSYNLFNRQNLTLMNKFEYKAISWNAKYLAFKTPSYDGIGELLISIIHYTVGPRYEAVVYNIRSKIFRKISVKSLFESNLQFNYKLKLPNNINFEDIITNYRKDYPYEQLSMSEDLEESNQISPNLDITRKRKPNQLFTQEVQINKRTYRKTSVSKPQTTLKVPTIAKTQTVTKLQTYDTKTNAQLTQLQEELSKLEIANFLKERSLKLNNRQIRKLGTLIT